ncbi:MAG: prolipoprotein diacylglyceryl transferase, partial [Clostridiales bacterium]|nr:prolipoprotein diacylglyceryl transferase [Clostridiales bacterium]
VIGGIIGGLLYARHRKVNFFTLSDIVAPFLILAQAIGRWGNFANGEAYGYEVTDTALQFFPVAVHIDGIWHMATFFYESVWDLTGFILLFLYGRKERARGTLSVLYLVWYGLGRSVIEGLRTDSLYIGNTGIRVSQALSILLVIAGCGHLIVRRIKSRKTAGQNTEQL